MATTLHAIADHRSLSLQIVATGMHLDPANGDGLGAIRSDGWKIAATVPWPAGEGPNRTVLAKNTGAAIAGLALAYDQLGSDIVLVVGDRVEAFAAAAAAHLSGRIVAHVHGGDRAAGQVDDALRHAITKLAHVHFPATRQSAERLLKLGEDAWRIRTIGSPGVDGIRSAAMPWRKIKEAFPSLRRRSYALAILHPVDADDAIEGRRMSDLLTAIAPTVERIVVVHPNNDPGANGIHRVLDQLGGDARFIVRRDVQRGIFLGLMRDAAVMVGNSSSGIIEAASFNTPVINVGPRQKGRECGENILHVSYSRRAISSALRQLWDGRTFIRNKSGNVYGGVGAGRRIAGALARLRISAKLRRKLIAY